MVRDAPFFESSLRIQLSSPLPHFGIRAPGPIAGASGTRLQSAAPIPNPQKKEGTMPGWYELTSNDKGQYSFVLKAANGETVLRSEQYESKASA